MVLLLVELRKRPGAMVKKTRRRRSLELTCLYRRRNLGREMDRLWDEFARTANGEVFDRWDVVRHQYTRAGQMREAASRVGIRRARHSLSLAELRKGGNAYATYLKLLPSEGGRDSHDLANDRLEEDTASALATVEREAARCLDTPDSFSVDDIGAHAPPAFVGGPS